MNIAREKIHQTLVYLDRRFVKLQNNCGRGTSRELEMISKLAILELGGWIETFIDSMVLSYTNKRIKDSQERAFVAKEIVNRVYGFNYYRNIRPLLERIIGYVAFEKIRLVMDKNMAFSNLVNKLDTIHMERNKAAHTNWDGITRKFWAPSKCLTEFRDIYPIMILLKKNFCGFNTMK